MRDPRIQTLANMIIQYSTSLQTGEKVLIENTGLQPEFVSALVEEAYQAGALPFVEIKEPTVMRSLLQQCTPEQLAIICDYEKRRMEQMDAYIGLRAGDNSSELSDVPTEKMKAYAQSVNHPVHSKVRVPHTKWVVLRYPSPSMAQSAQMSTAAFENFYFDVCTIDYAQMSEAMDPLVQRMNDTDEVRIVGNGTDLTFSIKGIPSIKCDGRCNVPDGEVYTAPVKHSINGILHYNTVSYYQGTRFEDITFRFKDGKIMEATANNTVALNNILDSDEGARYIGEFAIGLNPQVLHPIQDTLFDEKIMGSFHFTPGQSYEDAYNGNDSSIHWDIVCIQRPEYGGGEIYFDNELIRKDGLFVVDDLKGLNPNSERSIHIHERFTEPGSYQGK